MQVPSPVAPDDNEGIRWYLEEYLLFPFDPAPEIAERVERRIQEIGATLFQSLFQSNEDAAQIWLRIRSSLAETRFQIASDSAESSIDWELLRDPLDPVPIACRANAFVRTAPTMEAQKALPEQAGSLRVLMVIARVAGTADVRFRAIAARVLQRLGSRPSLEVDVLRPATFDALRQHLESAHAQGRPYTIVHFDGHGIYEDLMAKYAKRPPRRKRGYLLFEDPDTAGADPVDGPRFAELLVDCGVPIVMLNACRSARHEPAATPSADEALGSARSFRSLADEMIGSGVGSVVAMQYNIYVETAAQFVADVYDELARSVPLAEAVTHARRVLFEDPYRTAGSSTRELHDWIVPVLYEAQPIVLTHPSAAGGAGGFDVDLSSLPPTPQPAFIGRDDSLLELDRTFQLTRSVLLWGNVGLGKTATAVEFGRWLAQTGGVTRAVLFTSFREHHTLPRVIDDAAAIFQRELQARDIEWLALEEERRVPLLLEVMRGNQCLWIWDNIDSVTVAPSAYTAWSREEASHLASFLELAAEAGTRFLLTTRTSQLEWLGDLALPLELPPMDLAERIELMLASEATGPRFESNTWMPLLTYSQGNPFVLSLLLGQAVSRGIDSPASMTEFLEGVRSSAGEGLFDTSVAYALQSEFSREEQTVLSLCSLFEGVVNDHALDFLVDPKNPVNSKWDLTNDHSRSSLLLERAARLGVLTALGSGYYSIHPGLPAHFQAIFSAYYGPDKAQLMALRFAQLYAGISRVFTKHYASGQLHAADISIQTLEINQANLRRALDVARKHNQWSETASILQALKIVLGYAGRWTEFARLVDNFEEVGRFDPAGEPLPERQSLGGLLRSTRVDLLQRAHRLAEAERLQREIVDDTRKALLNLAEGAEMSTLAAALQHLAEIERDRGSAECLRTFENALEIGQRAGDTQLERDIAYQMARAYMQPAFVDLDAAEYWLTYALDLTADEDRIVRGAILSAIGGLELTRFNTSSSPAVDAIQQLYGSIGRFETALQILPADLAEARAACQANLGLAYFSAGGDLTRAVQSFQEALAFYESSGDVHQVGTVRLNLAKVYETAGDLDRSRIFAEAASRSFASLAPNAEDDLVDVQDLLSHLNTQ